MGLKLKPLEDRVVVEPKQAEDKTASGIILPDTAKEKPQEATIVAVGPGKASDFGSIVKMTVKVGDSVLYGNQIDPWICFVDSLGKFSSSPINQ